MKKTFTIVLLSVGALLLSAFTLLQSGGMVGTTGAPGEGNCSGCHAGGAAGTTVSISATPAFNNNQHVPNTTYTINITVSHPSMPEFGFDCEILNEGLANSGVMTNAGPGVIFANAGAKKNATHSAPKAGSGSASFSFEWTSPSQGDAFIYVAGNAVNNNNNTGGDSPATTSLHLTSAINTAVNENSAEQISSLSVFPNPCNELSQLNYYLATSQHVKVELREISGKLVKVISDEKESAGPNSQFLDLKGVTKGVYFLKVNAALQKPVQKIICIQ